MEEIIKENNQFHICDFHMSHICGLLDNEFLIRPTKIKNVDIVINLFLLKDNIQKLLC